MIDPTIGNMMPFTPFGNTDPIECPPFICGVSFLREQLAKTGISQERIEAYIADLPRVQWDDEE